MAAFISKCVACGKVIPDGDNNHQCSKYSEAGRVGAQRKANDEELRLVYHEPRRSLNRRLAEGFLLMGANERE